MTTKAQYRGGLLHYYESDTYETTHVMAPVFGKEDFMGVAFDTTNLWGARDTAGGAETVVADASGGHLSLALTNTSEAQLAGWDWADQRTLSLDKQPCIEFRFRLSVLPTTGVIACLGLCGDHNAAVDTVAESIWFRLDGATGGLITVEHDDATTESSKVTTGLTLLATDWVIGRIECFSPTDIRFYLNGSRVASGTTFSGNGVPTLALQPVMRIGKESAGTPVGTMLVDYVKWWTKR